MSSTPAIAEAAAAAATAAAAAAAMQASSGSTEAGQAMPPGFVSVKESSTTILFPDTNEVFYNPVQEFNRDLSSAAITVFSDILEEERSAARIELANKRAARVARQQQAAAAGEGAPPSKDGPSQEAIAAAAASLNLATAAGASSFTAPFRVLEALSASGLRAIRYAKEIPRVTQVVANDMSPEAVQLIQQNITFNNAANKVVANQGDATEYMYANRAHGFHVVDLDPYGAPTPFLETAVQTVTDGGLLCVTATDTAVLCGNSPEACLAKYGARSIRGDHCHETSLRILLQHIDACANRYHRYIVPMLSMSIDFYVRVFVRVYESQETVKQSIGKRALVFHCSGCHTATIQPLGRVTKDGDRMRYQLSTGPVVDRVCEFCGFVQHISGPIWPGSIHDQTFLKRLLGFARTAKHLGTQARLEGMLTVVSEELDDVAMVRSLDDAASVLRLTIPPAKVFRSAVLNGGYRISGSHTEPSGFKTDAPASFIWDVLRRWAIQTKPHGVRAGVVENSPAFRLLAKDPVAEADFTLHKDAVPPSRKFKLVRFQENPTSDWGPKGRARKRVAEPDADQDAQAARHQDKKSRTEVDPKTLICPTFYLNGVCRQNENCEFSHDIFNPNLQIGPSMKPVLTAQNGGNSAVPMQ
ncbi:TRMT1 protein [Capsaspora owczarzaki ATCC 30864]|uniref:TRMT1 protein n=1 Tax=Capsaspora owczarzaki (strain ATCC 30864) TaxID=595528 RepID=UPI000352549C|nr:TRMT1 protein [Capsaspora owczarzaki ATCC 30864]|eukprot:XP_004342670.2 TRMT1 protein [Capsaspora owczarzaki ATCC 30864]